MSPDGLTVVVIGAGIVGVSAALELAEAGAEVVVVDRGPVAGEASGLNAGVFGGATTGSTTDVLRALRTESRRFLVDLVEQRDHDIGLDRPGTLVMIRDEAEWAWAEREVTAERALGATVELMSADELVRLEPAVDPGLRGAIVDPAGARADPVLTTLAIAAEATRAGAVIETVSPVTGLTAEPDSRWLVSAGAHQHRADAVVIAAGPWCRDVGRLVGVDLPIVPVRGQMWATEPQPPLVRHCIAAAESPLAWSTEPAAGDRPPELTHHGDRRVTRHLYGCQRHGGEIAFGGDRVLGPDRAVDQAGIAANRAHVAELLPALASQPTARTWAGLMPFSLDGRPLIGPVPDRPGMFVAGGLASSGFGRGPMAGRLVADAVLGRGHDDYDLGPIEVAGRVVTSDEPGQEPGGNR